MLSTLIFDGKNSLSQVLGGSESYRMSALKVNRTLVVLKATVDGNVSSHCWQDSGSSESYDYRVKTVADLPLKKVLNVADPYFSQCDGPTCEGE